MGDVSRCPTMDAWSLSVGLVGDVTQDVEAYRGWHADAGLAFVGDEVSRGLFTCASMTVKNRVGSHRLVRRDSAAAGLAIARTLVSHATMISNWPGMRDGAGNTSERLISVASDEFVSIFSALGLTRMDARSLSRVVRVGIVCGKGGMWLRYVDRCGCEACGGDVAWNQAADPFLEAETMLCVGCLAAARKVDSDTAAHDLALELVDVASLWDSWQRRHAPTNPFFEEPDGRIVNESELTSGMYGWCRASGRHPVDCVLPMKSAFREQAIRTYDLVTLARRNAGKTWATYR